MTGAEAAPAREYYDTCGVCPVGSDLGSFSGGTTNVRTDGVWDDSDTIEFFARLQVRFIRRQIENVVSEEARSAGRRRKKLPIPRLTITGSLALSGPDDDPAKQCFETEFDPCSDASVDAAVEKYRLFVIASLTAAVAVEQAIAREHAAEFWSCWEGA